MIPSLLRQLILLMVMLYGGCYSAVYGQSQKSFEKVIAETNEYLSRYCELNPFADNELVAIEDADLPNKVTKELKKEMLEYGPADSISNMDLIFLYQDLIVGNINILLNHSKFQENKIETLLNRDCDLSIAISSDRRLFNFSLAEKTGGTYRSRISITYHTESSPPEISESIFQDRPEQDGLFEGDGFSGIYLLPSDSGRMYLLTSYVRGCSYCFETSATVISWNGEYFESEFDYSVNSRDWNGGVSYDSALQMIVVDYVTDDLTPECSCGWYSSYYEDEEYQDDSEDDEGLPESIKCHCTFQFNGKTFELIKHSWEKIQE